MQPRVIERLPRASYHGLLIFCKKLLTYPSESNIENFRAVCVLRTILQNGRDIRLMKCVTCYLGRHAPQIAHLE